MDKPKDKVEIMLRASPELVERIDKECGGRGEGGRGQFLGRSSWILEFLHQHFGLPPAKKPTKRTPIGDLSAVPLKQLDPRTRTVVEMYNAGMTLRAIADTMTAKRIPTVQGGAWSDDSVRGMLERIGKRYQVAMAKAAGLPVAHRSRGFSATK